MITSTLNVADGVLELSSDRSAQILNHVGSGSVLGEKVDVHTLLVENSTNRSPIVLHMKIYNYFVRKKRIFSYTKKYNFINNKT